MKKMIYLTPEVEMIELELETTCCLIGSADETGVNDFDKELW